MQANRQVIEDQADEAQERATRWDAYRSKLDDMLTALLADDKVTTTCLSAAMTAIQEAEMALSIASAMEQASIPDLDAPYRSGQRPGSY